MGRFHRPNARLSSTHGRGPACNLAKNVEYFAGDDTGMDFYIVARDHSARASGGDTARDRRTRILRSRA